MARRWWTLGLVSVATFMLLLDITVVNTALPAIREDLDASFTDLQWVIDAYALTLAAFVLVTGSLADRLGRRRVFVAGLVIFTISSLAAGFANDATTLNVARAVQGVGGAAMFAVSLALIAQEFPPGRARGTAMGIYGATIGAAVAVGPLVGGALTEGVGWESVFFLNVPIGVAAIGVTYWQVRESRDPDATRIDWAGLTTFSVALFLLVFALLRGNEDGWGSGFILGLLFAAAALLVAFVVFELRVREPMLPLRLFRIRSFTGVQITAFGLSSTMFALFLYFTLYLQNFLGLSPFEAGLRYLPITVTSFFAAAIGGALIGRVPARVIMGVGLGGVGVALLLMGGISADSEWTTLLPGFIVGGAAVGMLNPVTADTAVSVVSTHQSGMAAGINDTFRQVGVAVGIAAWGAIFIARGSSEIRSDLAGTPFADGDAPRELIEATSSGALPQVLADVPPEFQAAVQAAANNGFLAGLNEIILLAALLAFAAAVAAFWLVREDQIEREPAVEPTGPVAAAAPGEAPQAPEPSRS